MMKRLLILSLVINNLAFSQTNVFPPNGAVGLGTVSPVPNSKLDIQGGGLNIGGEGAMDATLHIKTAYSPWDRLTQIHPSAASKPALNLMASTDASSNYNWWSWGVLSSGVWGFQPSTSFGGNTGLFVDRVGSVGVGTLSPISEFQVGSGPTKISLGRVPGQLSQSLGWAYQYIGLNMAHHPQGWLSSTDGANNGGSMIMGDPIGQIRIINVPSSGNADQYLNESQVNQYTRFLINSSGNVGIGTGAPDAKLAVKGTVHATEVKVDLNVPGPDYVFANNYQLPTLHELKTYIDQHKHLPEVPSAKEMEANGVNLGEMNLLLLKKIEELTLYVIDQNRKIVDQNKKIELQTKEIEALRKQIE